MQNKKNFLFLLAIIFVLSLNGVYVKAAGPMDGEVIDGSLLTSESSASDEKPLMLENGNFNEAIPYGTYLSSGAVDIVNRGNGVVYVSGDTYCYRVSDTVQVTLYLERLTNGGWSTYKTHTKTVYNAYVASTGLSFSVPKGYYYRVKGAHVAKKGSAIESCVTCTSGLYIN